MRKLTWLYFMLNITTQAHTGLAKGFVYLDQIDPSIQISLRYLSNNNFVGKKLPGYNTNRIILTEPTAQALRKIQQEVNLDGYSLVVYDAYRPQKAVNHFFIWKGKKSTLITKKQYYPYISKKVAFEHNYIARKSGHSRGSTVDLTLIKIDQHVKNPIFKERRLNGNKLPYLDDGTVDMGSSFDLLDQASHHKTDKIPANFLTLRTYLREKMEKHGFKSYSKEWWHYTLVNEPFPSTYFDFDIE